MLHHRWEKKNIYIHIKRKLLASEHPCACTGGQPWASVGTPACLHHLLSLLLLLLRQHKHNTDKNRTTIKGKKCTKKLKHLIILGTMEHHIRHIRHDRVAVPLSRQGQVMVIHFNITRGRRGTATTTTKHKQRHRPNTTTNDNTPTKQSYIRMN